MMQNDAAARAAQAFHRRVQAAVYQAGYRGEGSIPESMTFREWCDDLAKRGMKVDRKPFRLDDRPALVPIYDAIPSRPEDAFQHTLVIQKATQLGLTVWEVLADIYMAKKWSPINIGMFLPDVPTAAFKSEHRFMPIIRSVPAIHREMTFRADGDGEKRKVGEGNIMTRQIGGSLLMFLWTSGKVSTESRPMDVTSLDEVQGMTLDQIDKVRARMGDSHVQFTVMLSTANIPEADINFWYALGSQEVWHTECPHCRAMSDLSDPAGIFPGKSIAFNTGQVAGAPRDEYVWTCPACGGWIRDPQLGRYLRLNPDADPSIRSFMLPRTISPRITPRDMMMGWGRAKTSDQKKSFYNRTLARPYIDADQIPVSMTHCLAAVAEGKRLGLAWQADGKDCVMGIDQMGSFNVVIIKRRLPDGRQAVVHVEAIFNDNPFARCSDLMRLYGVVACVVEQLPNVNDARRFANEFPRRVFLAGYADMRDDMMVWGDDLTDSDRHTAAEDRSRYTVALNQYKAMQTALFRVRDGVCLFPEPDDLIQDVLEDGEKKRVPILRDWVFYHFTKTALIVEYNEKTGKRRPKVMKVGIDPHFSYANMLCDIAWARVHGTSIIIMPENPAMTPPATPGAQAALKAMPGLPKEVVQMIDDRPPGTCARCASYMLAPDGSVPAHSMCEMRSLMVAARDPSCPVYEARQAP